MIPINSQKLENIYLEDKPNIDSIIAAKKQEITSFMNTPTRIVNRRAIPIPLTTKQDNYLKALHDEFEKIVLAKYDDIVSFKDNVFNHIINGDDMMLAINKEFRHELIKRMGYKDLRDTFYPEYFDKVGIKSCIYCNSQLALTVRKANGSKSAKFQVDHYIAKSEYPCFSISFYNLYPTCASCNNSKSSNPVVFKLYSDLYSEYKSSRFRFKIDEISLLKYKINGITSKLKIEFIDYIGDNKFNETFAIEGIYNTQKDIAEELVIKSMIYNKTYTESLRISLEKLYKSKSPMLERLLVGNYTDERDIHKRPMAKFTMDIARQLRLIK